MEAILDTNFIIACVKKKIDFIGQLEEQGFKVLLPREVFQELKDLKFKSSLADKEAVEIALQIFSASKIKKTTLGKESTDKNLIIRGRNGAYIASLDAEIKRSVPNRIVIRESQNSIEIQRD